MTKEEQEQIIEDNLWLVEYVARKYKSQADWSDMVSAGRYGLVRGINKYDPSKGKPSTYLIHWVRAEVMKCLYEDRNVHLPWNRINKYLKERNNALFSDGIYPRFEVSLDKEYVSKKDDADNDLDSSNIEYKSSLSSNFINNVELNETREHILYVFESTKLSEKERVILTHRFGLYGEKQKTLKEIGEIIGYTAMGVQKIEKKALQKIRKNSNISVLLD